MSTTFEKVTPSSPGSSPADAAAAANEADRRAAQAKAVADRASKVAKDARTAAGEAKREAAKLRESADPKLRERHDQSVSQAKLRFLDAARAIDPIGSAKAAVRDHPFITVGAALGTGALVGSMGGTLVSLGRVGLSLFRLGKPLAVAAAQMAASRVAEHYAAAASPPVEPAAPSPAEGV